jgi:hypothetical protein
MKNIFTYLILILILSCQAKPINKNNLLLTWSEKTLTNIRLQNDICKDTNSKKLLDFAMSIKDYEGDRRLQFINLLESTHKLIDKLFVVEATDEGERIYFVNFLIYEQSNQMYQVEKYVFDGEKWVRELADTVKNLNLHTDLKDSSYCNITRSYINRVTLTYFENLSQNKLECRYYGYRNINPKGSLFNILKPISKYGN